MSVDYSDASGIQTMLTEADLLAGALECRFKEERDVTDRLALEYILSALSRVILLGRRAEAMVNEKDWLSASCLLRGKIESLGMLQLFMIKYRFEDSREERRLALEKFYFSQRAIGDKETSIHVNDGLRSMKKVAPETMRIYDLLCEIVHPNWLGTVVVTRHIRLDYAKELAMVNLLLKAFMVAPPVLAGLQKYLGCEPSPISAR